MIALACSNAIYMFKQMKPFFKLNLPRLDLIPEELAVWKDFKSFSSDEFINELTRLKAADLPLSYKSLEVLSYTTVEK